MDHHLRRRVRTGDAAVFEFLFGEYARSVYNHAFRLTGSWSTAEEIVALTFLEAWRLRGRVDQDGGTLRPWLLGIATNVVRNSRRAHRRHEAVLARLPEPAPVPDFADELVDRLDDAQQVASVRAAMAGLRAAEREVVELCVWAGLDYAQAAEALGVPIGTVRSRLSRARRKLASANDPPPGNPTARPAQLEGGRTTAARSEQEETR